MSRPIYLGHDIPGYHERLCKAISRFGLPTGAPRAWLRDPDFQAWDQLGYMQPSGAMYWQCYLYAALQAAGIDQRLDLSTITILDQRWHFGERKWNFSPGKIKYRVQESLKGLNYIVMIEFQVFRNVRCLQPLPRNKVKLFRDQGRLIAPHVQGLIWGKLPSLRTGRFSKAVFTMHPALRLSACTISLVHSETWASHLTAGAAFFAYRVAAVRSAVRGRT
jgi:hypothetical protein